MRLRTIQAVAIKSVFEVLKDIINDVNLYFDENGVHVIALDIARTALVHMTLASENFEEYECSVKVIASMNMANTYKLLKSVTNNDTLEMKISNGETLELIVHNQSKKSFSKFNLKLLDIDEDLLESPDLDTDVITTIPSVDFQRICRDMGNLADDINIFRDNNVLELSCRGDFADQSTSIECPENINKRIGNTFSLKYINLFTKATGMCSSVQILQNSADDTLPIILRYTIANLGDMKFYLSSKTVDEI